MAITASDCAICFHPIPKFSAADIAENTPISLVCGHTFHNGCIKEWFLIHSRCPLDQKEMGNQLSKDISVLFNGLPSKQKFLSTQGLSCNSTVAELKDRVTQIGPDPNQSYTLIFRNRIMKDQRTLLECGIIPNSPLIIMAFPDRS